MLTCTGAGDVATCARLAPPGSIRGHAGRIGGGRVGHAEPDGARGHHRGDDVAAASIVEAAAPLAAAAVIGPALRDQLAAPAKAEERAEPALRRLALEAARLDLSLDPADEIRAAPAAARHVALGAALLRGARVDRHGADLPARAVRVALADLDAASADAALGAGTICAALAALAAHAGGLPRADAHVAPGAVRRLAAARPTLGVLTDVALGALGVVPAARLALQAAGTGLTGRAVVVGAASLVAPGRVADLVSGAVAVAATRARADGQSIVTQAPRCGADGVIVALRIASAGHHAVFPEEAVDAALARAAVGVDLALVEVDVEAVAAAREGHEERERSERERCGRS